MFRLAEAIPLSPTTDEEELRWYLRGAAGATGLQSNFEAMCWLGLGMDPRPELTPEEQASAIHRAHRVERALEAAGAEAEQVLRACLGSEPDPELAVYGVLAGLLPRLARAAAAHRASGTKEGLTSWLGRLPARARNDPQAGALLEALFTAGTRQFTGALLAFRGAKRRLGQARS